MVPKKLGSKNFWVQRNYGSKMCESEKSFGNKILGQKKILVWRKILCLKKFWVRKNVGLKIFLGPIKLLVQKFWVRNKFGSIGVWLKDVLAHKNYHPPKNGSKHLGQSRTSNR